MTKFREYKSTEKTLFRTLFFLTIILSLVLLAGSMFAFILDFPALGVSLKDQSYRLIWQRYIDGDMLIGESINLSIFILAPLLFCGAGSTLLYITRSYIRTVKVRRTLLASFTIGLLAVAIISSIGYAYYTYFPLYRYSETVYDYGFKLSVGYNTKVVKAGKVFEAHYDLENIGYTANLSYASYSALFTMVMENSTGQGVAYFTAPIAFETTKETRFVMFQPGQVWRTNLIWNGTQYDQGQRIPAPTGTYILKSNATITAQDVSMTISLRPIQLNVTR